MESKKKTLLIIKKGIPEGKGINRYNYRYKVMIKQRFNALVIKPYTLLFPKKLSQEEKQYIDDLLTGIAEYCWFVVSELPPPN